MTSLRDIRRSPPFSGAMSWLLDLCGLLLALSLLAPPAAHAHAVLESTIPADGASVTPAPAVITLNFSEAVSPIFARVLDRNGQPVTAPADASAVDNQLRIRIVRPLPDGPYMVTYRVVSADTHPVGGAFPFVVGTAGESVAPAVATASADSEAKAANDAAWLRLITINRAAHLTALLLAAGAVLYLLLIEGRAMPSRPALSRLLMPPALIGMLTAVIATGLQGALMAEAPLNGLFTQGAAAVWTLGAMTTRGASSLLAAIGLLFIAVGLRTRAVGSAISLLIAGLLIAGMLTCMASLIVAGHAATVEPRWVVLPAWIVHTVVAAFWIGSLAPLLISVSPLGVAHDDDPDAHDAPRAAPPGTLRAFGAFSRIALPGVIGLLAAGVLLTVLQFGSEAIDSLDVSSRYALVLAIKLTLVVLLLGLALLNRLVLVPRLAANAVDGAARSALRRSLTVELMVGIAIIAAAAMLSQQVPPSALRHAAPAANAHAAGKAAAATVIEQSLTDAKGRRARLRITRETDGSTQLAVQIVGAKSEVLTPIAINLELANSAAGIEPLERKLVPSKDGSREFRYSGRDLVVPGRWSVRIDAVITDFEQSVFSTAVDIGAR
jgi:copper transport protein